LAIGSTLKVLPVDEGEHTSLPLLSVAVFDKVASHGIDAQFYLRDLPSVWVRSQRHGANISLLIEPYSLERPMSEEAIGAKTDATHHRPIAQFQVTTAFDKRSIHE
jgi:hypothetical protein